MRITETPIYQLENNIYIKREDLIPFSFGGNKARKAMLFFEDIEKKGADCIVTYGSSSSNHCRVIANMAASKGTECVIVTPEETSEETYNSVLTDMLNARRIYVPIEKVSQTIDREIERLKNQGKKPYFIPGGGHGNIGTQAYVNCFEEIMEYEKRNNIYFDYIFFASGTGTTQAGLLCGQLINNDLDRNVIGISIARKNPRGRNIIIDSIKEYSPEFSDDLIQAKTHFIDDYVDGGYGKENSEEIIELVMDKFGIPLDTTYTGKAYKGMLDYISKQKITSQNVLFIHTGGAPLYFDYLLKKREKR